MPDKARVDESAVASDTCMIFAYGSIMWKPQFKYTSRQAAYVNGYVRRFWQSSDDHRGTPSLPGKVACLIRAEEAHYHERNNLHHEKVWGYMYELDRSELKHILHQLDVREQNGYVRTVSECFSREGLSLGECFVYVCCKSHPSFGVCTDVDLLAATVAEAKGASGPNIEYLLKLEECLDELGRPDEHITCLARKCRSISSQDSSPFED